MLSFGNAAKQEEMLENEAVSLPSAVIREDEIEKVIAQWTGVPVERIGTENQQGF